MLKEKFKQVKEWTVDNKEELKAIAIAVGGVTVGAIGCYLIKDKNRRVHIDYEMEIEGKEVDRTKDIIRYQLEDQDECWVLIAGTTNIKGKKTNIQEIGRQIAAGEYREGR